MTMYRGRTNRFRFDRAKSMATTPERIDALLHQATLVNPTPPLSAGALEAKQNMEKAKQLKGEAMPDITTALKTALENSKREALNKTLDAWEKDEKETQLEKPVATGKQNLFEITNNVTRATFEYVRDNPRCTKEQVLKALSQYNESSVGSLLAQFVLQERIIRDADGRYSTIVYEYKPLMTRAKWYKHKGIEPRAYNSKKKDKKQKLIVVKRRTVEDVEAARAASGIETLAVAEAKSVGRFKQYKPWSPDEIVNTLNVMQARQLYDYLKNVFGG